MAMTDAERKRSKEKGIFVPAAKAEPQSQAQKASAQISSATSELSKVAAGTSTANPEVLQNTVKTQTPILNESMTADQRKTAGLPEREGTFVGQVEGKVWDTATNTYKDSPNAQAAQTSGTDLPYTTWKQQNPTGTYQQWLSSKPGGNLKSTATAQYNTQLETEMAGEPPAPPKPAEGATQEDILRQQADYQRQVAEFYKKRDEEKAGELATVSGQVADFGVRLDEFRRQNEQVIANLNSQFQGLGDQIAKSATDLQAQGLTVDLNAPSTQAAINKLAQDAASGIFPTGISEAVIKRVLSPQATVSAEMGQSNGTSSATPVIAPNPTVAGSAPPPATPADIDGQEEANFYDFSNASLSSITDMMNSSGLGDQFNSGNYLEFALMNTVFTNEKTRLKLQQQTELRKDEIKASQDKWDTFFNTQIDKVTASLDASRIAQLDSLQNQEESIRDEKAITMADLEEKSQRYEGYAKAKLAAAGVPLEGQAGLTILSSSLASWQRQVDRTRNGFNSELSEINDKMIEVENNYANSILKLTLDTSEKKLTLETSLQDKLYAIDSDLLKTEAQIEISNAQTLSDYLYKKADLDQKEKASIRETESKAQDRLWELQVEGIKAAGGVPTMGADGRPTAMIDESGNMVMNFEASKFYAGLKEVDVSYNEFLDGWFGKTKDGRVFQIPDQNIYNNGTGFGGNESTSISGGSIGGVQFTTDGTSTYGLGPEATIKGQGECVGFARLFVPDLPDNLYTLEQKLAIANSSDLQEGSVVFFDTGQQAGHAAVVTDVREDGTFDVIQANQDGKGTITTKGYDITQIARRPDGQAGIYNGQVNMDAMLARAETTGQGAGTSGTFSQSQRAVLDGLDPTKLDNDSRKELKKVGLTTTDLFAYKNKVKQEGLQTILDSANGLLDEAGLSGAVGAGAQKLIPFRNFLTQGDTGFIAGTGAANFASAFNTWKNQQVIPLLAQMKGAISDKDILFLQSAANNLSLDNSEEVFVERLEEIIRKLEEEMGKPVGGQADTSSVGNRLFD